MAKTKKNKKLFGMFAVMCLSLVLALSLGIGATIAWFKDSANNESGALQFGGPVNVAVGNSGAITFEIKNSESNGTKLLPGTPVTVDASAIVGGEAMPNGTTATDAVIRATITVSIKAAGSESFAEGDLVTYFGAGATIESLLAENPVVAGNSWFKAEDGKYYLIAGTASAQNSTLAKVSASADGTEVELFTDQVLTVNTALENGVAGDEIKIAVVFDAAQAYFGHKGTPNYEAKELTIANALTTVWA